MEDVEAPAEPLEPSDTVSAPEQNNVQLYMEGLSRLDRTVDDSGYAFTALDVVDKQLTSLDAISNYTHLRFVNVSKNQIADLTPLGELPHLVCVDASENALAAPCSLPQAYLQTLDVSQNQIESLQGFQSASLALLKANGNQLTAITGLSGMPSLQILEAACNNLEDLSSLASETSKLERLSLQENKLTSVRGIEAHPTLQTLSLQMNNIESMDGLESLTQLSSLTTLDLSGNPVVETENYRLQVILLVPHLKKLDDIVITDDERFAAVELKHATEAAKQDE